MTVQALINLCCRNKNNYITIYKNLRTIEAQIVQKRKNEPQPKSTGSY